MNFDEDKFLKMNFFWVTQKNRGKAALVLLGYVTNI